MGWDELDEFEVHELTFRPRTGTTGAGKPLYADPVTVRGFLSQRRRFTRNADGDQVVSQARFTAGPDAAAAATQGAQAVHTASKTSDGTWQAVTDGLASTVITVSTSTSGDLDLPDHVTIELQ